MSHVLSYGESGGLRLRELGLWSMAGAMVLAAHVAGAALLMREDQEMPSDNAPPAAIMIELAPEPEAVNTEQEQIAPDTSNAEEVISEQVEPVEEPQPEPVEQAQVQPEPQPEPLPESLPEPLPEPPPEPVAEPAPEPETTQTIPTPPPPVEPPQVEPEPTPEPIDPIEQQATAALENVEVPLPMTRPVPPAPAPKTAEPAPHKPAPPKPVKTAGKPKPEQAQKERTQAALPTTQSDRTAARQTSTGFFSSSVSPAKWKSRVEARIARNARKCPGNGTGTAAVRFNFDGSGNITKVSLSRSSGDSSIDDYVVSAVRRASPIPAPPSGVASYLDQALKCE